MEFDLRLDKRFTNFVPLLVPTVVLQLVAPVQSAVHFESRVMRQQ